LGLGLITLKPKGSHQRRMRDHSQSLRRVLEELDLGLASKSYKE